MTATLLTGHLPPPSAFRTESSTLLAYLQAEYPATVGGEDAVSPEVSGRMIQGATEEAGRAGLDLLIKRVPYTQVSEAFHQLQRQTRLGGVIFASYDGEKQLRRLTGLGLPTVLLGHDLHLPQLNTVRDDSYAAARQAVHYLAGLGHRRIAFAHLEYPDLSPWRQLGFRKGLRELGLLCRRKWEIPSELTPHGARCVLDQLATLSPRPTALYCADNSLARLIIAELRQRDVAVPEELSILGGGGEDVPGLTCHQADWYQMGRVAIQILRRALTDTAPHHPEHHLLANVFRPGHSTAPCGRHAETACYAHA